MASVPEDTVVAPVYVFETPPLGLSVTVPPPVTLSDKLPANGM